MRAFETLLVYMYFTPLSAVALQASTILGNADSTATLEEVSALETQSGTLATDTNPSTDAGFSATLPITALGTINPTQITTSESEGYQSVLTTSDMTTFVTSIISNSTEEMITGDTIFSSVRTDSYSSNLPDIKTTRIMTSENSMESSPIIIDSSSLFPSATNIKPSTDLTSIIVQTKTSSSVESSTESKPSSTVELSSSWSTLWLSSTTLEAESPPSDANGVIIGFVVAGLMLVMALAGAMVIVYLKKRRPTAVYQQFFDDQHYSNPIYDGSNSANPFEYPPSNNSSVRLVIEQ